MQYEHYTHTAPDIPSSTALSIFSIMGTANDKSYDTTHDNLEDDTHQDIHQVSHQDSTPSAVILHLIPHFQLVQKRILRKRVKHDNY